MQGLFLSVEGPDGSGKSTLVAELSKKIAESINVPLVTTREPGGSDIAEKIREFVLNPAYPNMDDRTEALLYAASRRQHVVEKIRPALERGEVVLCDRFVDSSIAYQGAGRQIGVQEVAAINQFATEDLTPDLTLYLDIPAEIGLGRISDKKSNRKKDRLELEDISFHNRIRDAYLVLLEKNKNRMILIDATQTEAEVLEEAFNIVEKILIERSLL